MVVQLSVKKMKNPIFVNTSFWFAGALLYQRFGFL